MAEVALQPAPVAHVVGSDQPLGRMSGSLPVGVLVGSALVRRW
jgi:hypothetical protein